MNSSDEGLKRRSISSASSCSEKFLNKTNLTRNEKLTHLNNKNTSVKASSSGLLSISKLPRESTLLLHSSKSNGELEWDRDKDFYFKIESETLSYYDLNEHATELINSVSNILLYKISFFFFFFLLY
jgi:hypothetical protein